MNAQRTIGFLLVAVGIMIMLYALFSSYLIFTASNEAPELFSTPMPAKQGTSSFSVGSLQDLQNQLPGLISQQLQGVLPPETISQLLNLAAWSMLAGLLLFGGSLIAGIGVKLVK